tara:strand:- start:1454 stop:2179 length:726 start_codon:yes stop_codon:yes gene_type:complete
MFKLSKSALFLTALFASILLATAIVILFFAAVSKSLTDEAQYSKRDAKSAPVALLTGPQSSQGDVYTQALNDAAEDFPPALQVALTGIKIVNGCHPYLLQTNNSCPWGAYDSYGWAADGSHDPQLQDTVWVSSEAIASGAGIDVLLHELSHALVDKILMKCEAIPTSKSYKRLLVDAVSDLGIDESATEVLADLLALYFGKYFFDWDISTMHTSYVDVEEIPYRVNALMGAAVHRCITLVF